MKNKNNLMIYINKKSIFQLTRIVIPMMICLSCVSCIKEQNSKDVPYLFLDPNPPVFTLSLEQSILDEINNISLVKYQVKKSEILMWTRYKTVSSSSFSRTIILIWSKIIDSANNQYWGVLLLEQECDSLHNCSTWSSLDNKGFVDFTLDSQQIQIRRFGSKRANDSMDKAIVNRIMGSRKIFTSFPTSSEIMQFVDMCGYYGYPIVDIITPMLEENTKKGTAMQTFFSQESWYRVTGEDINTVLPIYRTHKRIKDYDRIRSIYENNR